MAYLLMAYYVTGFAPINKNKYVIVERQKGRPPTMTKKTMNIKNYEYMTPEEKVQYLEKKGSVFRSRG